MAVRDGMLSNEQLGQLARRFHEIVRRLNEGALEYKIVVARLQDTIEDKPVSTANPYVPYVQPTFAFTRPTKGERSKSNAPYTCRLPRSLRRLEYPVRGPEHLMAEMWEAENIPRAWVDLGATYVNTILDAEEPDLHDVAVVASTLQWTTTSVGACFMGKFQQQAGCPVFGTIRRR